jgi:anionic cell wall polymer biosynthesis LytR-Cps2A-Psr (LCP) family protein
MKKKGILFLVFIAVLIPTGVIFARNLLNRPLNPPLELDVPFIAEVAEAPSNQSNNNKRTCGNSGKMNILQIGVASPVEVGHPGADLIRLVVVDFDQVKAGILALPADLWVNTPEDLVDDLDTFAPLNLIYLTVLEASPSDNEQVRIRKATQTLAQTILDEFGFVPDKYININGDAFIELVDTLDEGITITLDKEVDGTPEFYDVYPEGVNVLNGQKTLDFVRILYPKGIGLDYFGRFERQNLVIHALLDAVLQPKNWDAVPDLLKEVRKMVVTDLSVDQTRDLACMVEEIDGDVTLVEISPDMVEFDAQERMFPVDVDDIKELIDLLQGDSE